MNCPKCNNEIDEKATICPHCKKVLKLECPICHTFNEKNVCKKCGFTIITKCHKCSKIVKTVTEKCQHCGFSTYKSAAINASNTDEFACIIFDFPNITDIKSALKSTKLYEKFKHNLDVQISNFAQKIELHREIINGNYVLKFNKCDSFEESCTKALEAAISLQNIITELNFKLNKSKGITLESRMTILKRDIDSLPKDFQSNFDIKLIYDAKKADKLLNALQIITDSKIYEHTCEKYNLQSLSSVQVNGETIMFFELKLKKYIHIPQEAEAEEEMEVKLPTFEEDQIEGDDQITDIYDIDGIDFEELKSDFSTINSSEIISTVTKKLKSGGKKLVAIKANDVLKPDTADLIHAIEISKKYDRIFRVTCTENMKCRPWGFFHELISGIYSYSNSPKLSHLNNFKPFNDPNIRQIITSYINNDILEDAVLTEVKNTICDIFLNIIFSMNDSLLFIENFDKIDDSSRELLELAFEKIDEIGINYLIIGENISVHKHSHTLLAKNSYAEYNVKPSSFNSIIEINAKKLSNIIDTDYIKKIASHTKGSTVYFNQAMKYLLESGVIYFQENKFDLKEGRNVLIPATAEGVISKRLKTLSKDKPTYKLLLALLLLGSRTDFKTLEAIGLENDVESLKKLSKMNLIIIHNNSVYINNYELTKKAIETPEQQISINEIMIELQNKLFKSSYKTHIELDIYKQLEDKKHLFLTLDSLSKLNCNLGDFNAYMTTSREILDIINEIDTEIIGMSVGEYKAGIYSNLSELLDNYSPEKLQNISQLIIDNLDEKTDSQKIAILSSKILQGCMISGNYNTALSLLLRMTARLKDVSYNPADSKFNLSYFFISLMKIEILFGLGELKDCIELADDMLDKLDLNTILQVCSNQIPSEYITNIITDTMCFVGLARLIMLKPDLELFFNKLENKISKNIEPKPLFILLSEILKGKTDIDEMNEENYSNKFSKILCNYINASLYIENYEKFAKLIYQAKIIAKINKFHQLELISDLLIGYAYFKLKEHKKAQYIYENVMENSTNNGLKNVTFIAWYLVSLLKLEENDLDVAYGIVSNACIKLEKDTNSSDLLILAFKIVLAKISMLKGDEKNAQLFTDHAQKIQEKYGLNTLFEV